MQKTKKLLAIVLSLVILTSAVIIGVNASEQLSEDECTWVSAWSTSMVNASIDDLFNAIGATDVSNLTQKAGLSLLKNVALNLDDISCRSTLQPTIGGEQIRLTLSNQYGQKDVTIEKMTAARSSQDAPNKIDRNTIKYVTVNDSPIITIPAGQTITTDPINISVDALDSVAFTMYIRDKNAINTVGLIGGDSYIKGKDQTQTEDIGSLLHLQFTGDFGEYSVIPFISDMQVLTEKDDNASACVLIGDSTIANDIPIYLSEKLEDNDLNVSILQEAIKGNEVTQDGKGTIGNILGQSLEKRFKQDALSHEGVKYIIVKVGDNDIIHSRCTSKKAEYAGCGNAADGGISAQQVIDGYKNVLDQLKEYNQNKAEEDQIKIYFVSRSPWKGYTRNLFNKEDGDDIQWTPEVANECVKINQWLDGAAKDTNNDGYTIDGFIDMSVMEDPENPGALYSNYTPDGIHFTKEAQQVFTDIIPLSLFTDGDLVVADDDFYFPGLSLDKYVNTIHSCTTFYNGSSLIDPEKPPVTEPTTEETTEKSTEETTESTTEDTTESTTENTTEETTNNNDDSTDDSFTVKISKIMNKITGAFSKVTKGWNTVKDIFSKLFK